MPGPLPEFFSFCSASKPVMWTGAPAIANPRTAVRRAVADLLSSPKVDLGTRG